MAVIYIADAFRAALGEHIGMSMLIDVLILRAFSLVFLWLVHSKLDWRRV